MAPSWQPNREACVSQLLVLVKVLPTTPKGALSAQPSPGDTLNPNSCHMNPQQMLRVQNSIKMGKSQPIADFEAIGLSSIEFESERRC